MAPETHFYTFLLHVPRLISSLYAMLKVSDYNNRRTPYIMITHRRVIIGNYKLRVTRLNVTF